MGEKLHVVMIPWLAFGHMIPFFQLSKALAKSGVKVSLLSTPKNIQRLPKPPHNLSSLINLVELPFPTLDEKYHLPDGAEATMDIPIEKMDTLKIAFDLLKQPFRQFCVDHKPDWIFLDFNPDWGVDVAQELGIPSVWFSILVGATVLWLGPPEFLAGEGQERVRPSPESLLSPPHWVDFPTTIACRDFDASTTYAVLFKENATGRKDAGRFAKIIDASKAVLIRTCNEFEGQYLNTFRKLIGKPVIPTGLLLSETKKNRETGDDIFKWLDKQVTERSVVFVGFGSECKLTKNQVYEIAHGLELSNLPFIWALREPDWATGDTGALPSGYSNRTSDRGMVCMGWVPQTEVLAHRSIGGSLTHAGWSSVAESLQFGHVLVVLPIIVDQGLNARLLVDKGLCVEVVRNDDGSISRDDIAKCLRLAMVMEEGEELRARTREAALVFGDWKLQEDYIDGLVQFLKNGVAVNQ